MATWILVAAAALGGIGLPGLATAQVTWEQASPSGIREADRPVILARAAEAGVNAPVRVTEGWPQFGCRFVSVESEVIRTGLSRSWQRVTLMDGTPIDDCLRGRFKHAWRVDGPSDRVTQWLVNDGSLEAWIVLQTYYTWNREWTVTFEDARRIVLAFMQNMVEDRRISADRISRDPPLPLGREGTKISSVASAPGGGWEVVADGWIFNVQTRDGIWFVTSSDFPIP